MTGDLFIYFFSRYVEMLMKWPKIKYRVKLASTAHSHL